MLTLMLLPACALLIYVACGYFVNGVEWLGQKLSFTETATGTVLAALGTALPECAVTFVAVVLGGSAAQKQIGIGAAIGGPLVLATISYAVVGLSLMSKHAGPRCLVHADQRRLSQDQGWFLGIFAAKIGLGLVVFAIKPWLGLAFLTAYGIYLRKEIRTESTARESALEPLKLRPNDHAPSLAWIILQTGLALLVIGIASHGFVWQLELVGPMLHLPPQLVALLLSPLATELPETMNAVIWARQGKENLALANISGAMMVQATVPSALGLLFTPWLLDAPLIGAGIATAFAVLLLLLLFRRPCVQARHLVPVGAIYFAYLGWLAV